MKTLKMLLTQITKLCYPQGKLMDMKGLSCVELKYGVAIISLDLQNDICTRIKIGAQDFLVNVVNWRKEHFSPKIG